MSLRDLIYYLYYLDLILTVRNTTYNIHIHCFLSVLCTILRKWPVCCHKMCWWCFYMNLWIINMNIKSLLPGLSFTFGHLIWHCLWIFWGSKPPFCKYTGIHRSQWAGWTGPTHLAESATDSCTRLSGPLYGSVAASKMWVHHCTLSSIFQVTFP